MNNKTSKWLRWGLATLLAPAPLLGQFNSDLTGYWPLDSDLLDGSGNNGDGSFATNGAVTTPTFTTGGAGTSAQFGEGILLTAANEERIVIDGGGNASFPGENTYDFTNGSVTVSLWASTTAGFTSNWQALAAKGEGSSWRLSRRGESPQLAFAGGLGNNSAEGTSDASTGLHHIVAVSDADRGLYLYIDGTLESFVPGNPVITDSTFFMAIGGSEQSAGRTWDGVIDDVLLFGRPLTGPEVATIYNAGNGVNGADIIASADTDSDGIPDFYETANGMIVGTDDSAGDLDNDTVSNLDEYLAGTAPNNDDTDGDGLKDGDEITNNGDPFITDTDGDGLSDGDEVNIHMTLVDNVDSDNDQATDFDEIKAGTDPNDNTSIPSSWSIGLVGYWNFDDTLNDTSGSSAHGTFITDGAGTPQYTTAKFGNGINFNATDNERVEIQSVPESTYDFTASDMSVSLWCSTSGFTQNWQGIIAKGEGTSWRVARAAGTNEAAFNPGDWKLDGDDLRGGNIGDGNLHHIVAIVNTAGTGQLWIDGIKVAETTAAPVIGNTAFNMLIGANPGAAADNFRTWPGIIDDVAIWNRPLSVAEVTQLFNSGNSVAQLVADGDNDFDGLPNSWEAANGTLVDTPDADQDPDNDGRTNLDEFNDGTNPQVADADNDGLNDGEEFTAGTRPDLPDTDGDGLTDGDEVKVHMTSPILVDTDSDGFSDSVEVTYGTLPSDINSFPSLDQGLLGYWPLDDDLQDDTGNGGNGSYQDNLAAAPVFTTGKFGNGISLDNANNQYVIIDGEGGATTPPDYTQAGASVSISVWSSVSTFVGNWQGLVARGEGSAWRIAGRGANGAETGQYAFAGGTGDILSPASYDDGQFHHIVAVSENAISARLYIDGQLVATSGGAPTLTDNGNNNFIMIGSNPDATTRSWNGIIDDVAIWERALTSTEVSTIFNSTQSLGDQLGLGTPSVITVTNITPASNGSVDLTWTSRENATYTVFLTTDLSVPLTSWDTAMENVTSGGATTTTTIPAIELSGLNKAFFIVRED